MNDLHAKPGSLWVSPDRGVAAKRDWDLTIEELASSEGEAEGANLFVDNLERDRGSFGTIGFQSRCPFLWR